MFTKSNKISIIRSDQAVSNSSVEDPSQTTDKLSKALMRKPSVDLHTPKSGCLCI